MPAFIKTQEDEKLWQEAKDIVKNSYPKLSEDDPQFWSIVTTVFFKLKNKGDNEKTDSMLNLLEKAEIISAEAITDDITSYVSNFKPLKAGFTALHSLLEFDKPNLNKDAIPLETKDIMVEGIIGQACTWEHYPDIIVGSVVDAKVFDNKLIVATKFWNHRPLVADFVSDIQDRYDSKKLKFSFEIVARKVKCSSCGSEFDARINGATEHYCDCLKNRYTTDTYRIITDYIPIGEGVVSTPAYKDSTTYIAANYQALNKLYSLVSTLVNKINLAMLDKNSFLWYNNKCDIK